MKKDFYYNSVVKAKELASDDIWAFIQKVVCTCFMYEAGWVVGYDQIGYLKVANAGTWYYGEDETYHHGVGVQFMMPKTKWALAVDESHCFFNLFDCRNTDELLADAFDDVSYWSTHWMYDRIPMFREFINYIAMQHSTAG